MNGFIYFGQMATGAIKIGFTTDLDKRHAQLSHGCPGGIVFLTSFLGTPAAEAWLHQKFSASRISGEWFSPTNELLALINLAKAAGNRIVPADYRATEIQRREPVFGHEEIAERCRFYLCRLAEPVSARERIRAQIERAAARAGLPVGRTKDIWYGDARSIAAHEYLQLKDAFDISIAATTKPNTEAVDLALEGEAHP